MGSDMDLKSVLLPPNLPDRVSKYLATAMVDAIVIPGGFCRGSMKWTVTRWLYC